jgi:hypothetical protein
MAMHTRMFPATERKIRSARNDPLSAAMMD